MLRKKIWFTLVFLNSFLWIVNCSGRNLDEEIKEKPLFTEEYQRKNFDFQGHRGARGLAPENTWPAFQTSLQYDVDTLELDIHVTKDKQLIIHHDHKVNSDICQFSNEKSIPEKRIRFWTLDELKNLDCGSKKNPRFPDQKLYPGTSLITLDELFEKIREYEKKHPAKKKVFFNIETKIENGIDTEKDKEEFAELLVRSIHDSGMIERSTIQSFDLEILPFIKNYNPNLKTAALFSPGYWKGFWLKTGILNSERKRIIEKAAQVHADIISPHYVYINKEFIKLANEKKLRVIPWTVNDKKTMIRLIRLKIDGMITDYPNRFSRLEYIKEVE